MELDRPVEEVEAVVGFYYKKLRQALSELKHGTVQASNLGNFYIKEKQLDKEIAAIDRTLGTLSNLDITEYSRKKNLVTILEKMRYVKSMLDQERGRRKKILQKRYGNES